MMKSSVIVALFIIADVAYSCWVPPPVWRNKPSRLRIECPDGPGNQVLTIIEARYFSLSGVPCTDAAATIKVKDECDHKHWCNVNVGTPPFGCSNNPNMRLWVKYSCCVGGKPQPDDECERIIVERRPVVNGLNGCVARDPIRVWECQGGCESTSEYVFGTSQLKKDCQCCVPTETEKRTEILKCTTGKRMPYTFVDIKHCDCKPCEDGTPGGGGDDECHVDEEEIIPRINGCVGREKITVGHCHGGCPSKSGYNGRETVPDSDCECCVPKYVKELYTTVYCRTLDYASTFTSRAVNPDLDWLPPGTRRVKYQRITHCHCQPCKKNPVDPGVVTDVQAQAVDEQPQRAAAQAGDAAAAAAEAAEAARAAAERSP